MRNVETGANASRTTKLARRATAALLAGGLSLGVSGCNSGNALGSGGLEQCKEGWEATAAFTTDPSADSAAMQQAIAELVNKIDGSTADEYDHGYALDTVPHNLLGAANVVLKHSSSGYYVRRNSELQDFSKEFCEESITGSTYRTPAFMSAVGALASAGIVVQTGETILPTPVATH